MSTVGPFSKWGLPAARAAVAAGCTYIDTTGEPEFIRRLFAELDEPARRSGARLLPSLSYEFAAGSLAGALALDEAGDDAVRVDVGYYALGGGPNSLSAGTRESLVGIVLGDHFAFRDGAVQSVRSAERVRSFNVAGKAREAFSLGGAEHYALPDAFERLREVNVYTGWFGPLSRRGAGGVRGGLVRAARAAGAADDEVLGRAGGVARGRPGARARRRTCGPGSPRRRWTSPGTCSRR